MPDKKGNEDEASVPQADGDNPAPRPEKKPEFFSAWGPKRLKVAVERQGRPEHNEN